MIKVCPWDERYTRQDFTATLTDRLQFGNREGEFEGLKDRAEKMEELLVLIVGVLSDEQQRAILKKLPEMGQEVL